MIRRDNSIECNVGKIEDTKLGNVFLIDGMHAVTLKHCIVGMVEPIKLVLNHSQESGHVFMKKPLGTVA